MRYVIGLSFAALAVWILQATGVFMAIMMFLLIGTIPGTAISVPPIYMLGLLGVMSLGVAYWLFRQRPVRQIQNMRKAYAQQIATPPAPRVEPSMLAAGYRKSFDSTRQAAARRKQRAIARLDRTVHGVHIRAVQATQPIRMLIIAISIVSGVAAKEITAWARPHIARIAAWITLQIRYSVKGTMLSAHRWSSLSRKLLSSLMSLLKRCNSALKRGKSLFTRAAR
jgi:hypothetical protein